jgi:hypothetical protein
MKLRMKLDAAIPKIQRATPEYVVIPSSVAGQACSAAPATPPEGDATQHGLRRERERERGRTRSARGALQRAIARTAQAVAQRGRKSDKPDPLAYEWKDGERDPAFADRHVNLERGISRSDALPQTPESVPPAQEGILHRPPSTSPAQSTPPSAEETATTKLCGQIRSHQRINDLQSGGKISTFNTHHPEQPLTLQDMGPAQCKKMASHLGLPPSSGQKGVADVLNRTLDAWRCLGFYRTLGANSPHGFAHTHEYRSLSDADQIKMGLDAGEWDILWAAKFDRKLEIVVNDATQPPSLGLVFLGLRSLDDLKNVVQNAVGGKGTLTETLDEIANIFAKIEKSGKGRINLISGHSMGGASAQYVAARLATSTHPQVLPSMVLLDPQLLNNRHAAWAVRSAENDYKFDRPRGVVICLDSPAHPRKNLMGVMKSYAGYRYPGLLEVKMPCLPGDVVLKPSFQRGGIRPTSGDPRPMFQIGYHMDPGAGMSIYEAAIHRFLGTAVVGAEVKPLPPESSVLVSRA